MSAGDFIDSGVASALTHKQDVWEHNGVRYGFSDLDNATQVDYENNHDLVAFKRSYQGDFELFLHGLTLFHNDVLRKEPCPVSKKEMRLVYSFFLAFRDSKQDRLSDDCIASLEKTGSPRTNFYEQTGAYYHRLVEEYFKALDIAPVIPKEEILRRLPELEAISKRYEGRILEFEQSEQAVRRQRQLSRKHLFTPATIAAMLANDTIFDDIIQPFTFISGVHNGNLPKEDVPVNWARWEELQTVCPIKNEEVRHWQHFNSWYQKGWQQVPEETRMLEDARLYYSLCYHLLTNEPLRAGIEKDFQAMDIAPIMPWGEVLDSAYEIDNAVREVVNMRRTLALKARHAKA